VVKTRASNNGNLDIGDRVDHTIYKLEIQEKERAYKKKTKIEANRAYTDFSLETVTRVDQAQSESPILFYYEHAKTAK
jgi:hypothetical protein